MKILPKSIFPIVICFFLFIDETQSQSDKIYHGIKFSVFSELLIGPAYIGDVNLLDGKRNQVTDQFEYSGYENKYKHSAAFSFVNFSYSFRFNLFDPSENLGIGLNTNPNIGLSVSDEGFGTFTLPCFLSMDIGAGSTYQTTNDHGFFLGFGYEINKIALFGNKTSTPSETYYLQDGTILVPELDSPKTFWIQPVFTGGIRWWSKKRIRKERLSEFSIKIGIGSNSYNEATTIPGSIQLSWGHFINY